MELRRSCLATRVRLRVLVLYRDPLAATVSRIRMMQKILLGHALLQARIVEANLDYLSQEVATLTCGSIATARYEDLLATPLEVGSNIAVFVGASEHAFDKNARMIKEPKKSASSAVVSGAALQGLRDFFGYEPSSVVNGTFALSNEVIAGKGWWPLIAPEVDVSVTAKKGLEVDSPYCCTARSNSSFPDPLQRFRRL
jgi:hypothetical protein